MAHRIRKLHGTSSQHSRNWVGLVMLIEGYACFFGEVDRDGDIFKRYAFTPWLRRLDVHVPMLFEHSRTLQIGVWELIQPDRNGLFVRGLIYGGDWEELEPLHQYVVNAIDNGHLRGMSIGFRVKRHRKGVFDGQRVRIIETAELHEISLVHKPAISRARFTVLEGAARRKHKEVFDA